MTDVLMPWDQSLPHNQPAPLTGISPYLTGPQSTNIEDQRGTPGPAGPSDIDLTTVGGAGAPGNPWKASTWVRGFTNVSNKIAMALGANPEADIRDIMGGGKPLTADQQKAMTDLNSLIATMHKSSGE